MKHRYEECDEGKLYRHYANHKEKEVGWDWVWCHVCYPNGFSTTYFGDLMDPNWVEIDIQEYGELLDKGYKEHFY